MNHEKFAFMNIGELLQCSRLDTLSSDVSREDFSQCISSVGCIQEYWKVSSV